MTDDQFVTAFETCTIRSEEFHHADHVRLGFLYMCRFPVLEGMQRFSEALQRLADGRGEAWPLSRNDHMGVPAVGPGTLSALGATRGTLPSWDEFATENKDLLKGKGYVLKEYYTHETLKSELARKIFILPDRSLAPAKENGLRK